ncbi:MAG: thiamine-monophosphate kinase [Candidatus Omnitrophica bacterium]|nr:thiamine-monophosphate kinase [Candidatus Omnitrophota bacterium]MBI2174507.1 thiamine-monophosphate kinase [Candidatus Omnitrophota bacterium]MBI3010529.1 thiamine-monophosphate kinase [Candidatus Omnitrophota bacterium]
MRTIQKLGEVGLIERMKRRLSRRPGVLVGIGDDAAVLRTPRAGKLLFASDMIVEGVHFDRSKTPADLIGWKALACNVSDIAVMGGSPLWAVVSLGLPPKTPIHVVDEIYRGLERGARQFDLSIVGGDTVRAPCIIVDVAIIGQLWRKNPILRSGARLGDDLYVTGTLGGSYASGHHARFIPRLKEAQSLLRKVSIHAMMDLSDGLALDLWQMSYASERVLRVEASRVPVARTAQGLSEALHGGEDFELLFAAAADDSKRVPKQLKACPVTKIGWVVKKGIGVELEYPDGRVEKLKPRGFRHF